MFWGKTLSELFDQGGFVMYPLLVCSIVAVSVAVERILVLILHRDSYDRFVLELETQLTASGTEGARSG